MAHRPQTSREDGFSCLEIHFFESYLFAEELLPLLVARWMVASTVVSTKAVADNSFLLSYAPSFFFFLLLLLFFNLNAFFFSPSSVLSYSEASILDFLFRWINFIFFWMKLQGKCCDCPWILLWKRCVLSDFNFRGMNLCTFEVFSMRMMGVGQVMLC